jgi:hypothetical protein
MMVQSTTVKTENIVMEEEEEGGIEVLHMEEEEAEIEDMMMKNLEMRMMIIIPNFALIADNIEGAIVRRDLVN